MRRMSMRLMGMGRQTQWDFDYKLLEDFSEIALRGFRRWLGDGVRERSR